MDGGKSKPVVKVSPNTTRVQLKQSAASSGQDVSETFSIEISNVTQNSAVIFKIKTTAPKIFMVKPATGQLTAREHKQIRIQAVVTPQVEQANAKRGYVDGVFLIQSAAVASSHTAQEIPSVWKELEAKQKATNSRANVYFEHIVKCKVHFGKYKKQVTIAEASLNESGLLDKSIDVSHNLSVTGVETKLGSPYETHTHAHTHTHASSTDNASDTGGSAFSSFAPTDAPVARNQEALAVAQAAEDDRKKLVEFASREARAHVQSEREATRLRRENATLTEQNEKLVLEAKSMRAELDRYKQQTRAKFEGVVKAAASDAVQTPDAPGGGSVEGGGDALSSGASSSSSSDPEMEEDLGYSSDVDAPGDLALGEGKSAVLVDQADGEPEREDPTPEGDAAATLPPSSSPSSSISSILGGLALIVIIVALTVQLYMSLDDARALQVQGFLGVVDGEGRVGGSDAGFDRYEPQEM
jgi:regulator of replication initiation timing